MKRYIYIILALLIAFTVYSQQEEVLLTYTIDYNEETKDGGIILYNTNSNIVVDWGNGQKKEFLPESKIVLSYIYPVYGNYTVNIYGEPNAILKLGLVDMTTVSSIIVGKNCMIESLSCHYGSSSLVEISNAIELVSLNLSDCHIISLDMSNNPNIENINLSYNPITKDKVALLAMIESLPDRTGKEAGILTIDMGNFPRHKAICERKNWVIK